MSDQESKTKKIIREISEKIDELLEKSDISKEDVKREIDTRIKELKKSRDELNVELKKIREENKETFDKVEKLAKNTANQIKSAFSDFIDKFSEKSDQKKKEGDTSEK